MSNLIEQPETSGVTSAKRVTFMPGASIVFDGTTTTITQPSGHVVTMGSNIVLAPMLPVGIPLRSAAVAGATN